MTPELLDLKVTRLDLGQISGDSSVSEAGCQGYLEHFKGFGLKEGGSIRGLTIKAKRIQVVFTVLKRSKFKVCVVAADAFYL